MIAVRGLLLCLSTNLVLFAQAVTLNHNVICVATCQGTLSRVPFSSSNFEAAKSGDYYSSLCGNELRVKSMFYCAKEHCTSNEIITGSRYVNNICEVSANITLPPFEQFANVTDEELRAIRRIEYGEIFEAELNTTALPSQEVFKLLYETLDTWRFQMSMNFGYGRAMCVFWGIVLLVGVGSRLRAMISFLPRDRYTRVQGDDVLGKMTAGRNSKSSDLLAKYITTSAAFGQHCQEPVGWCTIPPRVQSMTIAAFVLLNIVACSTSYRTFAHNSYWDNERHQWWRYFSDRTGIIAFANMPILWLFGMRNDVVIWLTGWSFGSFTNFHRWVSRVATVEAILHSVGYTITCFVDGDGSQYWRNWTRLYWNAGVIATIIMSFICVLSLYPIRRKFYEIFLRLHIGLAAAFLVGCYYHVIIFGGEYNGYIWPCVFLWVLDRFLRLFRVLLLNFPFRRTQALATYSPDSNIIRLKILPTINFTQKPGTHYYLYMSNGWNGWESHPFTLLGWDIGRQNTEIESENMSAPRQPDLSLTFLIRPYDNFTARLRSSLMDSASSDPQAVNVLIEGPYGEPIDLDPFDSILFLVGGSGIAVAISYLHYLASSSNTNNSSRPLRAESPTIHLVWSVKEPAFVREVMAQEIALLAAQLENLKLDAYVTGWLAEQVENPDFGTEHGKLEFETHVGRPNVAQVVARAVDESEGGRLAVFGCGPAKMVDDARQAVVEALKSGSAGVRYFEENFEW